MWDYNSKTDINYECYCLVNTLLFNLKKTVFRPSLASCNYLLISFREMKKSQKCQFLMNGPMENSQMWLWSTASQILNATLAMFSLLFLYKLWVHEYYCQTSSFKLCLFSTSSCEFTGSSIHFQFHLLVWLLCAEPYRKLG